jgi:hypothetical protein
VRRILPYIFGLRALLVIVVMVAGFAGYNLRADAATPIDPDVTYGPPAPTATPASPAQLDGPGGASLPSDGEEADEPSSSDPTPTSDQGGAGATGSLSDPSYVRVVLAPRQVDTFNDVGVAATWALGVLVFCAVVSTIILAKGARS